MRPVDGALKLQAAASAVKQWIYKPLLIDGHPVETWKEAGVTFR